MNVFRLEYDAADGVALSGPEGREWQVAVTKVASFPAGSFESTPIVWQGRIYVGSRDGYFYCLGDPDYTAPESPAEP
jgi:outer membrane protein assembly factor BamB